MDSYCVEVFDDGDVFLATVTDGSGATALETSRVSAWAAASDALAALMPDPEVAA